MLPTRAALPIDPDTCPAPTAELSMGLTALAPLVSGANAPEMAFGPERYAAAPCPFWPQAYAWPNDRNGPPGMLLHDCGENGPVATDQNSFQFVMALGRVSDGSDAAVVVEPALVVDEEAQGDRALYVALTRATKRLAVVHELELPRSLLP